MTEVILHMTTGLSATPIKVDGTNSSRRLYGYSSGSHYRELAMNSLASVSESQ